MKPGIGTYYRFKEMFDKFSKEAGKEQYLIPYFIAAHPGTTTEDMLNLALWLKQNSYRADQVQAFLPSPMALATAMWHSERNPLKKVSRTGEKVFVPEKFVVTFKPGKEMELAWLKSVVGFLNTDGGIIVITSSDAVIAVLVT